MTGSPGRLGREAGWGGGRNASHQITPHTNRLLSTLSEPIIWANNHPGVCLAVFVCLCVGVEPHLLPSDSMPGVYCTIDYCTCQNLIHSRLSKTSPQGFFPILKCSRARSDEFREAISGYPVSRPAPELHVQSHRWPPLLHLLSRSHLMKERRERQEASLVKWQPLK